MKKAYLLAFASLFLSCGCISAQDTPSDSAKVVVKKYDKTEDSQWKGKRVAFLGDSMTDKRRVGTTCIYWEYLPELLGLQTYVYGINGHQWTGIYGQAVKMHDEMKDDVDAIFIFAGTNDYNSSVPLGNFFTEDLTVINRNGKETAVKHREPIIADSTFCGRINKVLSYLKENYPTKQIIIMTPIHRAYAKFGEKNIQPDENYSNAKGLFIDEYINALKQAGSNWSVPVIDLYSLSGLYPLYDSNVRYFHNGTTDRLHPNALGDYRIARTIQYQLLALPATF